MFKAKPCLKPDKTQKPHPGQRSPTLAFGIAALFILRDIKYLHRHFCRIQECASRAFCRMHIRPTQTESAAWDYLIFILRRLWDSQGPL